jgi:site-specific recombinase XerD
MTALAPYLSGFLREHLPKERRASQHTCEAYAQSFQLLLGFAAGRLKITPAKIELEQLDAPLMLAFLEHLEKKRGNSARTRNARLAAIHSFFRFLEYRLPSCLDQSRRIHAIPMKKTDQALIGYLTGEELQALLDAPTRARYPASATEPCCIWPLPQDYACRSWSVSDSIRLTAKPCPAYTSWERGVGSESCRSGRKRRPR